MSQTISQYIQQQIGFALAEKRRRDEEALEKLAQETAKRNAESVAKTLRALSLLGIEAGEGDLSFDADTFGYYLLFNKTIRISLQRDGKNGNWLSEEHYPHDRNPHAPKHTVFFALNISRVIPDEYRNDEGELMRGFYWSRYICEHRIDFRAQEPITRLGKEDLLTVFSSIDTVETQFRADEKAHLASIAKAPGGQVSISTKSRFTYTGDSREEILAALLEDIRLAHLPEVEF